MRQIHTDTIIGNFILEKVLRDKTKFNVNELLKFDRKLSKNLTDFYDDLSIKSIEDFVYDYPFIARLENNKVIISQSTSKEMLLYRLERYFRIGIPKTVLEAIRATI